MFVFTLSEIKHKTRYCQRENQSNFIHKMYKEIIVKRKIVNLKMRKNE